MPYNPVVLNVCISVCPLLLCEVKPDSLAMVTDSMVTRVFTLCGGVFTSISWEVSSDSNSQSMRNTHAHTRLFSVIRNISVKCQVGRVLTVTGRRFTKTGFDPIMEQVEKNPLNHCLRRLFIGICQCLSHILKEHNHKYYQVGVI